MVTVGFHSSAMPEPNWMADPAAFEFYVNFKRGSNGPELGGERGSTRLPLAGSTRGENDSVPGTSGSASCSGVRHVCMRFAPANQTPIRAQLDLSCTIRVLPMRNLHKSQLCAELSRSLSRLPGTPPWSCR